jgi:hypothetical protein
LALFNNLDKFNIVKSFHHHLEGGGGDKVGSRTVMVEDHDRCAVGLTDYP